MPQNSHSLVPAALPQTPKLHQCWVGGWGKKLCIAGLRIGWSNNLLSIIEMTDPQASCWGYPWSKWKWDWSCFAVAVEHQVTRRMLPSCFLLLQRSPSSLSSCVQMLYSSSSAPAYLCYAVTEEAPYYLLLLLCFRILKKIQVQIFLNNSREGSLSLVIPSLVFHTALAWPVICRFLLLNFNIHSPWRVRRRFRHFPPNPSSFEISGMVSYINNLTRVSLALCVAAMILFRRSMRIGGRRPGLAH